MEEGVIVNDMSYGYRLGAPFVEAVKNPAKTFVIPFKVLHLGFDLITRQGREKQRRKHKELLENSENSLKNHSDFVKSTAGYQLGIALIESIAHGPIGLRTLPQQIRKIYRDTFNKS